MQAGERNVPAVRAALRNGAVVRVLAAYTAATVGEWAVWVGVLVFALDKGGSAGAGYASVTLLVAATLTTPAAGAAADGRRPNRVMALAYLVLTVTLALASVAAFLDAPLIVTLIPCAMATASVSFVRPSMAVVVPGLVTSARELTAANLLAGYADGLGVLGGPLLAGVLLAADGPGLVIAACTGLTAISAIAMFGLVHLDPPAIDSSADSVQVSRLRRMRASVESLGQRDGATPLLIVLGGSYLIVGAIDLLAVLLAVDELHLGASGPGYLSAAVGVGAVAGGMASTLLIARQRLAPVLVVSLVVIAASFFVLGSYTVTAVAVVVLATAGLGRAVLDVTGKMLMQRVAPQEALASIFATVEALALLGSTVGSIVVQVLVAVAGVRAAAVGVGVIMLLLLLTTVRQLRAVDESADAPVVAIRLLRRVPVFAPLPGPAVEGVARAAHDVLVPAGTSIVTEGEVGDHYFVIADGEVEVIVAGVLQRRMHRGEGFGEIALLASVPRTATVVAHAPTHLLQIERTQFLTAVTGHDASRQAAWAVARSWNQALRPEAVTDDER